MTDKPQTQTRGRIVVRSAVRSLLAGAIALSGVVGCDDGSDDAPEPRDQAYTEGEQCVALFESDVSALKANLPTAEMSGYDFDNGNAAIELVIPNVVPVLFQNVKPGDATIVLRFTTLLSNAWFDAVAPYHPTAVGVYSDLGRRPASESLTNAQMNVALLYASYRALNSLAPQAQANWAAMLTGVGLDPNDSHEGTGDAIGIGNKAGNALVAARENDGMNQLGFDDGRDYNAAPYADYTGYKPKNTAFKLKDDRRWQPQLVTNPYGIARVQHFVTPQYALVEPYSYDDPGDFDSPKPKASFKQGPNGKKAYRDQANEVLEFSANLTELQKMKSELFDDKIRSLGFSALFATLSQGLTLMEFIQYDFMTNMAAFDTGIIIWQEKTKWNAVRPFTAIRKLHKNKEVTAWGGPGMGTVDDITGSEWSPYLQTADHPEYPSASASFCAAHAEISRMYLGSDNLNWTVPNPAGSSLVEPGLTPSAPLDIQFNTWSEFEADCGDSRIWAGVHFAPSVPAGQDIGHEVAQHAYDFVVAHIDGTI